MGKYVDITFKDKTWLLNGSVQTCNCRPNERCGICAGNGRCPDCNGQGEYRCTKCGGRGIIRCTVCRGGGRCYHCNGRGVVEEVNRVSECVFCHGSGLCNNCNGSGTLDCFTCFGKGFITCYTCSGNGRCGNCGGSGAVTCRRCQGTGFYQQFIEYTSYYCVRQFFYPGLKPELLEGLRLATGEELYKAVCKLWRNKENVAFDDTEKCLKQFCDSLGKNDVQSETFKKEYEAVPEMDEGIQGYMPYKNTLTSYKTPVTKIVYEINGQKYTMYLLGDNGVVCYEDFPKKVKAFDISDVEKRKNKKYAFKRHKELALLTAYIFNLDGISPKESKSLSLILQHMGLKEQEREDYIKRLTDEYTSEVPFETVLSKIKHLLTSKKTISYVWQCIAIDNEITPREQSFFDKLVSCYNISESELDELKRFSSKFAAMGDEKFVEEYLDSGPVKSKKKSIITGIVAGVLAIAAIVGFLVIEGNKDIKTSEEQFAVELPDQNEAELSNLVLDAYKTHEIYNLETSDFQAARKAATAAEEASGSICIDRDYYYCTQDDYPNRFDVTRVDFINPNKANVYVELIFDREVFNREGNYFTDNVVLTMVRNSGSVWLVDDVWHGGNSIKQEMIECTRDIQNEIMSNTSSNVAKVSSNAYEGNQVVVIDGSELRLRLSPSTSSDTFKWPDGTNRHPNVGERFKYLGESGDFYKIDFNGNELWVSKQFTHVEGTTTTRYTQVSCIKVSGGVWFVLDHRYSDGETIRLENATFGLYGATGNETKHQQLLSGGDGELLRIGQRSMYEASYGYVYFNLGQKLTSEYECHYGHVASKADGYILNMADVVLSPSNLSINGKLINSYSTRHLNLSTDMCLFANNKNGDDVVHNQKATLGTVTITDSQGGITAEYIPVLDNSDRPCFYNTISGAFIYHTGSGTPDYEP